MSLTNSIMTTLSLTVFGAALLASPAAQADDGQGRKGAHKGDRVERMCSLVECTPEQRKSLEGITAKAKAQLAPVREEQRDLRQQMRAERESDSPDATKVERLRAAMKENHTEMKAVREGVRSEIDQVLTDEQEAKLKAAHEARKAKRGEKGKKGKRGKKGKKGDKAKRAKNGKASKDGKPGKRFGKGKGKGKGLAKGKAKNRGAL